MGLFGGITGALFGGGGEEYSNEASNLFKGLNVPGIEEQMVQLQKYVEAGIISPEEAQAALQESNAYDNMNLDTQGRQAQLAALQQLQDIGNEGGLTAQDKAQLNAIQNEEQTKSRGAREAILQNAQARGAGGSGLEMLQQMQNEQNAASNASTRDLNVASMAQQRALAALQAAGQQGSQLNQQQFNQEQAKANAANEIAKFNAQNTQQVGLANQAANNAAQNTNLQNKQNVANLNTQTANQQEGYNKGLVQQQFQNQLAKTSGTANALNNQAAAANATRANDQNLFGTILSSGSELMKGAGGAAAMSDERVKKDVSKFDAGNFLDSLTGYKYNYKDPGMGEGKQVGVMAQDVEKSVPQMVEDTPEGKMVDYSPSKAGGPIFAGLSDLHERLKKLEGR